MSLRSIFRMWATAGIILSLFSAAGVAPLLGDGPPKPADTEGAGLAIVDLSPNGLFITKDGATCQLMVLTLRNSGGPASLILDITSVDAKVRYLSERLDNVAAGTVTRELAFPALDEPRAVKVTLSRPGPSPKVLLTREDTIAPAPRWEVYLVPGSPVDYAYGCSTLAFDLGFVQGTGTIREKLPRYLAPHQGWPVKKILIPVEYDWSYPYASVTRVAEEWNRRYVHPRLIVSTPRQYFAGIDAEKVKAQNESYVREDWSAGAPGLAPLVQLQQQTLASLLNAEKYATLDYLVNDAPYPYDAIRDGWRKLALTYDHNYGYQHDAVSCRERLNLLNKAVAGGGGIIRRSLAALAACADRSREGTPIVVFNPLFTPREDRVAVAVPGLVGAQRAVVKDADGRVIPCGVEEPGSGKVRLHFLAKVPGLGFATFYLQSSAEKPLAPARSPEGVGGNASGELRADRDTLENKYYRLSVDLPSGTLRSIYDKELGRELLDSQSPCGGSELLVDRSFKYGAMAIDEDDRKAEESGLDMTSERRPPDKRHLFWRQRDTTCTVSAEANEAFARIEVRGAALDSPFRQTITLYAGLERIYFDHAIDWQGRNHAKVKLAFPFLLERPTLTIGEPYGARTMTKSPAPCVQKWLEINDGSWGVSMATSAGQHGFVESTLYPVLFWDENSWTPNEGIYWFSPKPWPFQFRFAITSHRGDWKAGKAWTLGWDQAYPLDAVVAEKGRGRLPGRMSFISCLPGNVVPTVLKVADDHHGVILRYYEAAGSRGAADFALNEQLAAAVSAAWSAGMTEEKRERLGYKDGKLSVPTPAFGIETIRLEETRLSPVHIESTPTSPAVFRPYTEAELAAEAFLLPKEYIQNTGLEAGQFTDRLAPREDPNRQVLTLVGPERPNTPMGRRGKRLDFTRRQADVGDNHTDSFRSAGTGSFIHPSHRRESVCFWGLSFPCNPQLNQAKNLNLAVPSRLAAGLRLMVRVRA